MSRSIRKQCRPAVVTAVALFAALATTSGLASAAGGGTVTGSKTLGATDITCGGSVPVTLTLNGETGLAGDPVDIELVLDRSGSMQGQPIADLKVAAARFVDIIDEGTDGALDGTISNGSRLGVVSFADGASVDAGLSGNANAAKSAISALVATGQTNHSDGIATGQAQLAGSVPGNRKLMVIFTDGMTTVGPDASPIAAAARAAGTEIFGIGLGNADSATIQNWTTDPDSTHYFFAPTSDDLEAVFEAIGAAIVVPAATNITVLDTVSGAFSISGAAASKGSVGQAGNLLTWTLADLRTETVTLTFTATHNPAAGGGVLAVNPSVGYTDTEGHVVAFGNPTVNVHGCAAHIDVEPEHAVNELGTPGQTHTVTATVTDDFGDPVSAVNVSFDVLAGPNSVAAGSGPTGAAGTVDFTYPAQQGLAGLGTDSIRGCFTTAAGNPVCDDVLKDWVDTTPPVVSCTPINNPAGGTIPPADNQDGFYQLNAVDAVDPDPSLTIRDDASPAVFTGFPDGTKIKLVQAPGAPTKIREGTLDIDWKVTLNGDALITAVDAAGNESAPISCRVPPPPS